MTEPRFLASVDARCLVCDKTIHHVGEFLAHIEKERHFWWISNYTVFHVELTCFRGEKKISTLKEVSPRPEPALGCSAGEKDLSATLKEGEKR